MLKYLIKHPTLPNLIMMLALIAGAISLGGIQRDTFPEVKAYSLSIQILYAGASARVIESAICEPLEQATTAISNLKEKTCNAQENSASMTLKMRDGGNFNQFKEDVNKQIDGITGLPDAAEDPVITEIGLTNQVVSLAITADLSSLDLYHLALDIKDDLQKVQGVSDVDMAGFAEHQYRIEIDPAELNALNLSLTQLASTIASQSKDMPLGTMETSDRQISLRLNDKRQSLESLENIIVRSNAKGGELKLGDIAVIKEGFSTTDQRIRFNGKEAAVLTVFKNTSDDGLSIFDRIETFVDDKRSQYPIGVELELTNDGTSLIKDRIQLIAKNGVMGLILVFLVVWLFFSWKYSFWVAMGLPVSFFAAFTMMNFFGLSLNLISMVALLIALGILMDDAIVISESIAERVRVGREKLGDAFDKEALYEAVYQGVIRVRRGVLSSFATTTLIFSGTLSISGDIGQVLVALPITLLLVVSISLLEAFFILPNHLAHVSSRPVKDRSGFKAWFDGKFDQLTQKVGVLANWSVDYPYRVVALALFLFFASISLLAGGVIKFSPFPSTEGNRSQALIHMPAGTTESRTEAVVNQIITALYQTNEELTAIEPSSLVENVQVSFGQNTSVGEQGDHVATVSVDILDAEIRNNSMADFQRIWRDNIGLVPDAQSILVKEPALGPAGQAILIRLSGEDLEQLNQTSLALQSELNRINGVVNLKDDLNPGKQELEFSLKPGAYSLGMTSNDIANQLRTAFVGQKIYDIQNNGRTTEVSIWFDEQARDSLDDIDSLVLFNERTGDAIPLDQVAELNWGESWSRILRFNDERTVSITGDVDSSLGNTAEIVGYFSKNILPDIKALYPDIRIQIGGESENSQESMSSLATGFILALFGVYILLSAQFKNYGEPLLVMAGKSVV